MKFDKKIIIPVLVILVVLAGGVYGINKWLGGGDDSTTAEDSKKKRIAEPVNVIGLAERPYIQIAPVADGRNVEIIVKEVKKEADAVEYELEYQAGTLLQGAFGQFELPSLPAKTTVLLGSCSAGGACTYHEDVQGGKLLTRFTGPENYALQSEWRYIDNSARETDFASRDSKFQLSSADLASHRYVIVFNSAGYPDGLESIPVSDPYSLAVSGNLSGEGELTMRANEEGDLVIMGWDGADWTEYEGTVDGKSVTATVDLVELYIVVSR